MRDQLQIIWLLSQNIKTTKWIYYIPTQRAELIRVDPSAALTYETMKTEARKEQVEMRKQTTIIWLINKKLKTIRCLYWKPSQ